MRWLAKILLKLTGWHVTGGFPDVTHSVVVAAPHTSAVDAFFCKVAMVYWGVPHRFLIKKEQFKFPRNFAMKLMHAIPVGLPGQNLIHDMVQLLSKEPAMHIVICPEGTRQANSHWNPGFYVIAKRAGVPITTFRMDYKTREMQMVGIIPQVNVHDTMAILADIYRGVHPRYPAQFLLPESVR